MTFFYLLLKNMTWRIRGFNKTLSHATQLEWIWHICIYRGDINWPPKLHFFVGIRKRLCLRRWTFNSGALKNQYVSKNGRKLPQKNQCLHHFAWRSFKWFGVSYIKSTFNLYKRNIMKTIFSMCFIYVYFWNQKMNNPINYENSL